MRHIVPLKPRKIFYILKRLGFEPIRQKGSHIFFSHPDGRATVVPNHKGEDISKGLIKSILNDIEMDWNKFISTK